MIPISYNDLTVRQFQEVNRIVNSEPDLLERHIKLISCLLDKPLEWVENHTPKQIGVWAKEIDQLLKSEISKVKKKYIVVNGTVYRPADLNKLKAGQVIALKMYEERSKDHSLLHDKLACVFVPINWLGMPKDYNSELHKKISKDMLDCKLGDVYGTLFFYSVVYERLKQVIEISLKTAAGTIEEMMPEVMKWAREHPEILKEHGLSLS